MLGFVANSLAAPGVPRLQWPTVTGTRATCFADNRGRVVVVRGAGGLRMKHFCRDLRGHEAMLAAFREAMASSTAPETDGAAGRADLSVVLAAYRSLAERWIVELTC